MMFKTHLIVGFLIGLILSQTFKHSNEIIFALFVMLAAVFPDIDSVKSKVGRNFLIGYLFKHTGIFHSVFFAGLITLFIYYLTNYIFAFAFLIGYLSHIMMDAFTVAGVAFLYPLSKIKVRGIIRTGKFGEKMLFLILIVLNLYVIVKYML